MVITDRMSHREVTLLPKLLNRYLHRSVKKWEKGEGKREEGKIEIFLDLYRKIFGFKNRRKLPEIQVLR